MPNVIFKDVELAFTQNMTRESDFGGYNYSFIIDKDTFCNEVRKVLATQKNQVWNESKNTDKFILDKTRAKSKEDVEYEPVNQMMKENDVLVQVKCKTNPIENNKRAQLGRGTRANILIDIFEYEYGKKQFVCIRSHADRGCTIQITQLVEFNNGNQYFTFEDAVEDDNAAVNFDALEENEEIPY